MSAAGDGLPAELEAKIAALSRRCIQGMYEDPFWMARFGERGRKHALEDSEFHVKYVVAALREADASVFENYARWLRGVLTSRGMCSWHLAESFRQLGRAIHDEGVAEPEPALSVLESGRRSLDYAAGDAGLLAARSAELRQLGEELGTEAYRLEELWSFLLDAVHRDDAPSFREHVGFVERALVADDTERARLARTLSALRGFVSAEVAARLFG